MPFIQLDFYRNTHNLSIIKTKPTNYLYLLCITVLPGTLSRCPPLESAVYEVTVMISLSLQIGGCCAYINYNSSDIMKQSFDFWINDVQNDAQRCHDKGTYKNYYFGKSTGFSLKQY